MSMPSDDAISKVGPFTSARIEVYTDAGRRRTWTAERKAAIVAESYAGLGSVCDVARRHGLTPTQLFAWRRADRRRRMSQVGAAEEAFVPAIVDASEGEFPTADDESPLIGVEVGGASMWICRGADIRTVTAIVKALKGDA
jgi:transposase